jgi:predicted PurR-regulated permease PerM
MLLIALTQGFVSGIGFAIFGVPSATLWGSMAAVGSLVPGVGTAIVIAPMVMYLLVTGSTVAAIGLAIWGIIAVGMVDNFLGPILVGRGVRIHALFILFAVIGGVQYFGPLGFILGPLVLSLLYALLDIHRVMESEKA